MIYVDIGAAVKNTAKMEMFSVSVEYFSLIQTNPIPNTLKSIITEMVPYLNK